MPDRAVMPLKALCLKSISRQPKDALTKRKVATAFFSSHAQKLLAAAAATKPQRDGGSGGAALSLTAIRQGVIRELIENGGRSVHNDFPLPAEFFDDAFERMSLAASRVTGAFLGETVARRCPSLQEIDLSGCFLITDAAVLTLLSGCAALRRLALRGCRKLSDAACEHAVSRGARLDALDLGGCYNVTAAGVTHVLHAHPNRANECCYNVIAAGVACVLRAHPNRANFRELNLSGLLIADPTIEQMFRSCPKLQIVGVGFTTLTEAMLYALARALARTLRALALHWCPATTATDAFLAWAATNAPRLAALDLTGCRGVTAAGASPLQIVTYLVWTATNAPRLAALDLALPGRHRCSPNPDFDLRRAMRSVQLLLESRSAGAAAAAAMRDDADGDDGSSAQPAAIERMALKYSGVTRPQAESLSAAYENVSLLDGGACAAAEAAATAVEAAVEAAAVAAHAWQCATARPLKFARHLQQQLPRQRQRRECATAVTAPAPATCSL
ncbi:hypothetical protein JKP88DRAFT_334348 [Tribonema minus]|uniref:Uncharacterized protein n=1 Tax=Tribonema minus TaxID=303371 RepID=A0A835YKJ9_9STRA|nr:hypothetical protein JKP88DRAFT_334348 [Tribonema minus]